jgi:hypothetical protein
VTYGSDRAGVLRKGHVAVSTLFLEGLRARGKNRERREKERQQLADLVGKNLTYISQLEGLDFELYKVCHPPILDFGPGSSSGFLFLTDGPGGAGCLIVLIARISSMAIAPFLLSLMYVQGGLHWVEAVV